MTGKLKPEVLKDLIETYKLFTSRRPEQKYLEELESGILLQFNKLVKEAAKKAGVEPRGLEVSLEQQNNHNLGYTAYALIVDYKGQEHKFEPSSLFYEAGDNLSDAISSYGWAAWLLDESSPFQADDFRDSYEDTEAALTLREIGSLEDSEQEIVRELVRMFEEEAGKDQKEETTWRLREKNRKKFG